MEATVSGQEYVRTEMIENPPTYPLFEHRRFDIDRDMGCEE